MKILKNRSERDSEYEILFFPPFEANEFGNNSQINHFQPYNNYTCHCLKKKKMIIWIRENHKYFLPKFITFYTKVTLLKWNNHTTFRYWRMTNFFASKNRPKQSHKSRGKQSLCSISKLLVLCFVDRENRKERNGPFNSPFCATILCCFVSVVYSHQWG